jgi:O-antigen ligase
MHTESTPASRHRLLPQLGRPKPSYLLISAAVLGVVVLSWIAGAGAARAPGKGIFLIIALLLGILASVLLVNKFQLGVLLLPATALAVPYDLSTGTETKLPVSLLLTFMLTSIWIVSMWFRGWQLAKTPLNGPLLSFAAISIISLAWGIVWRDPGLVDWSGHFVFVQIAALLAILLSLSAAILIGNFVTTTGQLKYLMGMFIGCCSLMLVIRTLDIDQSIFTIRGLWALWLVAPVYALLITQPNLAWYWRLALAMVLVWTFEQILIKDSLWVSGWLPSVVAIFAITLLRSRKAFVVLAIVLIIAYQHPAVNNFFAFVTQENVDEGALERISIWEQSWGVVREHWLFGTGPAGYAIYYLTYYQADARSTHNNYLDILAQFGFSGMIAWLWLIGASLWEGWRLAQRAPAGFLRTMAITAAGGWAGALSSMFLGDWVLPFAYNQTVAGFKYTVYSWVFLGVLISIRRLVPAQHEAPKRPELQS